MNITTSYNDNYVNYGIVMLTSFLINNPGHHTYYMLNHSLSSESISKVKDALKAYDVEIKQLCIDFGVLEEKLPTTENWTIDTYGTLLIQEYLPEDVDRILYLDADTIVNSSIQELYSQDFGDNTIIAAIDSNGSNKIGDYSDMQRTMMGENLSSYFNTGTMLMNIGKIRENGGFNRYAEAMEKWDYKMTALEQDILNYVHAGSVKHIPWEKYNLFARFAHNSGWDYETVRTGVAIIHYAGVKPWQNRAFHYDIERLWWDYAEKTTIYTEIATGFLHDLFSSHEIEDSYKRLANENGELKSTLEKAYGLLQQLSRQ